MTAPSRHVAIAGAGIAGLTAALCLAGRGFSVSVFERAEKLEEVGAGIQLSPNATRILARLGLLGAIEDMAVRPRAVDLYRAGSLRRIATMPLGEAALRRWGAPYLTIHRADLHSALAQAVEAHPDITLQTSATARGARLAADGASLAIERGGKSAEIACDLAIGADGVRSTLRGTGRLARRERFSGYVAWRAMTTPDAGGPIAADRVSAFLHPRFHLVAYPVRRGEAMNLVVIGRMDAPAESGADATRGMLPPGIIDGAAGKLASFLSGIDTWRAWPVGEVAADAPWVEPAGLALVGDAAHAMGPYAAQGAVMAIEDAAALAAAVANSPRDIAAALARYEAVRRERVRAVARRGALLAYESVRRERVRRVAKRGAFNRFVWHAAGPVALGRDAVLALRGGDSLAADLDWLYAYDAEAI